MKKSVLSLVAVAAASTLSVAGCASAPTTGSTSSSSTSGASSTSSSGNSASGTVNKNFKACMVSDSGGFDDKSFNQTSLAGLTKAQTDLGIQIAKVESSGDADYATNIASLVKANCNMIVGVGFKLDAAIAAAAKANPKINFAIVDDTPKAAANIQPLVFNTAQSSFMAGYLAAAMSKTGKVGTFGGMNIPTVTIFMDGFSQGVDYYNTQKKKSVSVLGWNAAKQDGQFVPGSNPFGNVAGGKTVAAGLVAQGADILFPVAGGAGQGALQAAQASGGKVSAIWVDTDGTVTLPQFAPVIMTSVYKGMDTAVYDSIKAAAEGNFSNKAFVGTLQNSGTGLAPFHNFDSKVPADVKADLDKIKSDISSGAIKITSKSQPA